MISQEQFCVSIPGRYRAGCGTSRSVEIVRISQKNCALCYAGDLRTGAVVTLRIGTVGPFEVKVLGKHGEITEVAFSTPLYEPILQHLAADRPAKPDPRPVPIADRPAAHHRTQRRIF